MDYTLFITLFKCFGVLAGCAGFVWWRFSQWG